MALTIRCSECRKYFSIKYRASTRVDLAAKIGEYSKHQCKHCLMEREYHVNDIRAESSPLIQLTGLLIGLLVIFIVTQYFWEKGYITNIGLIFGGAIIAFGLYIGNAPSGFNGYRLTRTREEAAMREKGIERKKRLL